jgi:transcriptional regulator with XRE-family HTH domain
MADITTIETRRAAYEISKNRLCRTAGVCRSTYTRLEQRPNSGRAETFVRLGKALDALVEARAGQASHG